MEAMVVLCSSCVMHTHHGPRNCCVTENDWGTERKPQVYWWAGVKGVNRLVLTWLFGSLAGWQTSLDFVFLFLSLLFLSLSPSLPPSLPSLSLSCFLAFFLFQDRVSLCSPGCSWTQKSTCLSSQVLGWKVCATTAWLFFFSKEDCQQIRIHFLIKVCLEYRHQKLSYRIDTIKKEWKKKKKEKEGKRIHWLLTTYYFQS